MRRVLKGIVERGLVVSGAARLARSRFGSRSMVMAYHNIVPDGEPTGGDLSLHLSQRAFSAQLECLLRTHTIVPLREIDAPSNVHLPRVAITFDDACRGALTVGVQELARRGLPATFFVAPAFIGGKSYWWDRYSTNGSVSGAFRDFALIRLRGEDHRVAEWAERECREGAVVPDHALCATEEELRSAVTHAGIELGSHTWSHPNLQALTDEEVKHELASSLSWLNERFASVLPWISYPYGKVPNCIEEVAPCLGYQGGLRIDGGPLPSVSASRFRIPRLNVPANLSLAGFQLRIAGLLAG